jgi:hypothetical protein
MIVVIQFLTFFLGGETIGSIINLSHGVEGSILVFNLFGTYWQSCDRFNQFVPFKKLFMSYNLK